METNGSLAEYSLLKCHCNVLLCLTGSFQISCTFFFFRYSNNHLTLCQSPYFLCFCIVQFLSLHSTFWKGPSAHCVNNICSFNPRISAKNSRSNFHLQITVNVFLCWRKEKRRTKLLCSVTKVTQQCPVYPNSFSSSQLLGVINAKYTEMPRSYHLKMENSFILLNL